MPDVIYCASLASIGRTTHSAGTAAAHIKYIMRDGACEKIIARGIPDSALAAAAWIDDQECSDRKNARVCDKLLLALPHQLSLKQRIALVRAYCEEMSRGVPYVAALHFPSCDGDQRNYHCHIVFRDRDPFTGKRVMETSEQGSVERVRERWEHHVNAAMASAGFDDRANRRSHAERAIDRIPGIHVGPAATHTVRRASRSGKTPAGNVSNALPLCSRARHVRNSIGTRSFERVVDYPLIDGGFTRYEEHEYRAAINARLSRLEAQAAQAAHLAAARASMSALGLGMAPNALHQTLRMTGRIFVPSRTRAALRTAMAKPLPLTLSARSEFEAFDRAQQRMTAARSPRPHPVDAKAVLAGRLRAEAEAAALEHQAGEMADKRLAAARLPRPHPVDAKAALAGRLRDEAEAAAAEHHAGEVADTRLAVARLPRPHPVDAKAALAGRLRDEAEAAAAEHQAGEMADTRLAAARLPRPHPVDAKAALAGRLRDEAEAAAVEHHAGEVADNRLAAARLPRPLPVDAKAALARQLRAEAEALERHAGEVASNPVPPPPHHTDIPAPLAAAFRKDPSAESWAAWWLTEYSKPGARKNTATWEIIWHAWGEDTGTQIRDTIRSLIDAWRKDDGTKAMTVWLATAPKLEEAVIEMVTESISAQSRSETKMPPVVKQPPRPVIRRGAGGRRKDDGGIE